jgi:hypothetical protein
MKPLSWKRVFALLSYHYHFKIDDILNLTQTQMNLYLGQIPIVSTTYNLKEMAGAFFENYKPAQEFYETESDRKQAEFDNFKQQCEGVGLIPPER